MPAIAPSNTSTFQGLPGSTDENGTGIRAPAAASPPPVPAAPPGIVASPLADPHAWSSVTVAGMTIGPADASGMVTFRNAGRPYKWQIKDASGIDGGQSTYRGRRPPDWEIEFHIWTDYQFRCFQQMLNAAFLYDAGKTTVDPVDVYHPGLAMLQITQFVVDDVGMPEQQGDRKMWLARVKVHEFFPAPAAVNVTQTPEGAATGNPNAPGQQPSPAVIALQAAVEAQRQQAIASGALTPEASGLP
jgi:hypothetical protein